MLGRTISAELSHMITSGHHKCGARAICMHRGDDHDAYGPRSAYLRWNRAPLSHAVVCPRRSDLVLGRTISAELSHMITSGHHKCGARALCTHRGDDHDAYGPRSAYLRWNRAPLSHAVVCPRRSDLVLGRTISAELSHMITSGLHWHCIVFFPAILYKNLLAAITLIYDIFIYNTPF